MNICVYGAASSEIDEKYIKAVESLCAGLAGRGHNLVYGGGSTGLMGAAARGFRAGGGRITGVVPAFFKNTSVEAILYDADECVYTDGMSERKHVMEEMSDAFIIAPGGIGTFDEFFEALTLKQLRQMNKPIAIFNVDGYFNPLCALMEKAAQEKFLRIDCMNLYKCFSEAETKALIGYIEAAPEEMSAEIEQRYS